MATPKLPSTGDGTSMTSDPVSTVYLMKSPLHNFAGDKKLYKAWRKRAQQEKVDDIKPNLDNIYCIFPSIQTMKLFITL